MRRSKKTPDNTLGARPSVPISGVARIMGLHRATVYRRMGDGRLDLSGVPQEITKLGTFYDVEALFQRMMPGAEADTIALEMLRFIQNNGRLVRL